MKHYQTDILYQQFKECIGRLGKPFDNPEKIEFSRGFNWFVAKYKLNAPASSSCDLVVCWHPGHNQISVWLPNGCAADSVPEYYGDWETLKAQLPKYLAKIKE